jgi:hypothetical protein
LEVPCPPPCSEETRKPECILEDVVEDGLDDDEPFFLVKRLVGFFHMIAALFSLLKFRVATGS